MKARKLKLPDIQNLKIRRKVNISKNLQIWKLENFKKQKLKNSEVRKLKIQGFKIEKWSEEIFYIYIHPQKNIFVAWGRYLAGVWYLKLLHREVRSKCRTEVNVMEITLAKFHVDGIISRTWRLRKFGIRKNIFGQEKKFLVRKNK